MSMANQVRVSYIATPWSTIILLTINCEKFSIKLELIALSIIADTPIVYIVPITILSSRHVTRVHSQ